ELQAQVLGIRRVIPIGKTPFVENEQATRLQYSKNLAVRLPLVGRVRKRLDGKDRIVRRIRNGHIQEIGLHDGAKVIETQLAVVGFNLSHLISVVVDADNLRSTVPRHFAHGSADAATDVECNHARLQSKPVGEITLTPSNGRPEIFALPSRREMK